MRGCILNSIQSRVFIYFFECQSSLSDEAEGGGIDAVGGLCDVDASGRDLMSMSELLSASMPEPYHARGIVDFDGHFLVGRDMEHASGVRVIMSLAGLIVRMPD